MTRPTLTGRPRLASRLPLGPALCLALPFLLLAVLPAGAQRLYWEDPQVVVPAGVRFLSAQSGAGQVVAMWQEAVPGGGDGGEIYLSARSSRDGRRWQDNLRFAGPFPYEQRIAPIYSMCLDRTGNVFVAIASVDRETTVLRSTDGGRSFETLATVESATSALAPTLFVTAGGGLLLFVSQESGENLAIHYASSEDGRRWSGFRLLVEDPELPINFRPFHASHGGLDYVAFQGLPLSMLDETARSRGTLPYQIYVTISRDGGRSWADPVDLSFTEAVEGREWPAYQFANQRPYLKSLQGELVLLWERQFQSGPTQIYYAQLTGSGGFADTPEIVTRGVASSYFPRLVVLRDKPWLFWFDSTDQVFVADRRGLLWEPRRVSSAQGSSFFPYPVVVGEQLYVFWENRLAGTSRLVMLRPDQTVSPPSVAAVNFAPGVPGRRDQVRVRWSVPRDSSGIAGVGYSWGQDPAAAVPRQLRRSTETNFEDLEADRDGTWYFRIATSDFAGNWSEPVTISYTRDTVPPPPPQLVLPKLDEQGFAASNTFTIAWEPPAVEDVAGYSYALSYLGSREPPEGPPEVSLPARVETRATGVSYRNRDDGAWQFAVAAVDRAGNMSPPATALLRLNKYVPVTYISYVNLQPDPLGGATLSIGGRGFSVGGAVSEVLLDQDGEPPFEYTFRRSDRSFAVASDRLIRELTVADIEEGQYRVGVRHPARGLAWSPSTLRFESPGTVKYGDFSYVYTSRWERVTRSLVSLSGGKVALWLVVVFLGVAIVVAGGKLASLAQESRVLNREVLAVLRGEVPLEQKGLRMQELKRKGASLRLKFTLVTMILVLMTVLIVAVPITFYMIGRLEENLTDGLRQRTEVLLGSIANRAEDYLQDAGKTADLRLLPEQQIGAMEEARFITITGPGTDGGGSFDYVVASNDPKYSSEMMGAVEVQDELTPVLAELRARIDAEAASRVSELAAQADILSKEALDLVGRNDPESLRRLEELQEEIIAIDEQIGSVLQEFRGLGGSVPSFEDQGELLPFYTFYRPLVYRQPQDRAYYRGAVRLGVSTDLIRAQLSDATRTLVIRTGLIALVAAGLGLAGAILLASITVNPIRKLAAGVAVIRDTEDQKQLAGHVIDVRSRDEIGTLAMTVNQMTEGLVKAAIAREELGVGKDVQRMFIPLAVDSAGRRESTGGEDTPSVEIFGFYEGAKLVSGDYFYYRRLDDRHYGVIKCDVAGKGVPAALIMVEVATIFLAYFRNWSLRSPGLKLEPLAYQINEMLEERGFKGRFAALTLAIIDAGSGRNYLCHAGDRTLWIYRSAERRLVESELPDAPAAGVFPLEPGDGMAGFRQVEEQLAPGDTIFLFTDGITDGLGEVKRAMEGEGEKEASPGRGPAGGEAWDYEALGRERAHAIVEAVFNRRRYVLSGHHNPALPEDPSFDFTRCAGTAEEAVLALIAVEKVLRVLPGMGATANDRIDVDGRVDAFLQEHYEQYGTYFTGRVEAEGQAGTVVYSGLREEEQYDDLTILAIRKK
ncbi:MAG: SpoIIE family protein phosphatase [Spirochaetales bacterium]|nr:SpoIIE family protein phosphatase [Spirochaetales bacterium]